MTNSNFSRTAAFIWSVADLLRGDFKQSQYGRVILPFTLLRRLECVLEQSKDAVVAEYERIKPMKLLEEAQEKFLFRAVNGLAFFNISPMNLGKMGQNGIKDNLENYIQSFSKDAREIFEHFNFYEFIGLLDEANLLYKIVKKFATTPLSPDVVSNHEMGLIFEELIRRFAESSNETAGEHFTPRDIVDLTTSLVFTGDEDSYTPGSIRTIYDPTAGTGGFLSAGMEYVLKGSPLARMVAFGQELNPESYAICKGDMLIKGQDVSRIKLGNTLSNDQLPADKFDYMLSNPPFGVDWKKIEEDIKSEHAVKGFDGRFGAGLPRVSDGSLLFLMHLLSKMRDLRFVDGRAIEGSRIGIILNGSPLFTGSAGSGESEIRRYILEADLLEAIVALPTDMFYNTGIATYVWILSNKKVPERKGKVQLINATNLSSKMRKSLGSKRHYLTDEAIRAITLNYGQFEEADTQIQDGATDSQKPFASKIFETYAFGYRRLTIERPLRLSAQITDQAVESLRFAPKPFNAAMSAIYEAFGSEWTAETYGSLNKVEDKIRAMVKRNFPELKEKQIKDLLDSKIWLFQKSLLEKARKLQSIIGSEQFNDFNQFEQVLKDALKTAGIKLDTKEKKQFIDAITWKNPEAEPVIAKVLKEKAQPLYGAFNYQGKVVELQQDGDLRDNENVPLDPATTTTQLIEDYFKREVQPHVADAWINADKRDEKEGEIGVIGYEIPFNRYFYVYQPPRDLAAIDADLDKVSAEIMKLLQEVHS
ncbi:SAM-dependent DNA methyltransferase [Xenorhabdus sp. Reich]|uniref:site-specific DNA-methyltransferase (adenine-specific) n=1 Tax=Xenorhabdus littoralis TaxID=2582835 RepID=A0ABU4SPA2_9GAMM|nr:class I SAM-dependent DNA methyltransferase [Xenorhabdus sp. Reich]MDX8000482.1 SAM-dependent DNA methyltransferase [Xenorhabdus sp. Reich]